MTARWSAAAANAWYDAQPWRVGCNYIPANAINQIEMWDAATFDPARIDLELGWAATIGFNSMRVYLHDLCWLEDGEGFLGRVDRFLEICAGHDIRPLLVIFDDCWHEPAPGPQPAPRPGIHNSGWLRSPGGAVLMDPQRRAALQDYVSAVIGRFGGDERVLAWDLYNEVTNEYLPAMSLPPEQREATLRAIAEGHGPQREASLALLESAFVWARAAGPDQPLTAGVWNADDALSERLIELSDVISFHHYRTPDSLERQIARLRVHGRPLLCTEYMARTAGCTFATHLPILARERVACWNWGLVDGKTQTRFAWTDQGGGEPEVWFHDVLHGDGRPYREDEVALIRRLTGEVNGG